jgi:hypothetical protein
MVSKQRKQAGNIKWMRRKLGNSATTKVYTTDNNGNRREWNRKTTVEDAYIQENTARFSQTEGTPGMTEPLLGDLGYLADTEYADEILRGTYPIPEGTCPYAAKLIAELHMPDSIARNGPTSQHVSIQDHVNGWKNRRKVSRRTRTDLPFSHYKAGAADAYIAQFDATLRSIPYQHGFVLEAWIPTTDVDMKTLS